MRALTIAASLSASFALASLAGADCSPFSIHYGKPVYDAGEHASLFVSGTPGNLFVVLLDPVPGPTFIPGFGVFGVGFSSALYIEFAPKMEADGEMLFTCHIECGSPPVGVPYYTQVASIDPATLTVCLSNVDVLLVQDLSGQCSPDGCTPGYWKNHTETWGPTGYAPGDDFDTVFGVDFFDPDFTLLQALDPSAVPNPNLPTHAVAALLNASHPDMNDYPYTRQQVLDQVGAALTGGDLAAITNLKDSLDAANNAGCPF